MPKQLRDGFYLPDTDTRHTSLSQFEIAHIRSVLPRCAQCRTAIDIGAHVGSWAIVLSYGFDTVHAFEPEEENYRCLELNTEKMPNIVRYKKALGDKFLQGKLKIGVEGNSGTWYLMPGEDVEVLALDDYEFRGVDLLKIDVEGFEYFVIQGAKKTIERERPVIVIEVTNNLYRYDLWMEDLREEIELLGYRLDEKLNNNWVFVPQ